MGYEPEPVPVFQALDDCHLLQHHAHSLGYVSVPEELWERIRAALHLDFGSPLLYRDILAQQEAIERERR